MYVIVIFVIQDIFWNDIDIGCGYLLDNSWISINGDIIYETWFILPLLLLFLCDWFPYLFFCFSLGSAIIEVFPYKYWKIGYKPLAEEMGVHHRWVRISIRYFYCNDWLMIFQLDSKWCSSFIFKRYFIFLSWGIFFLNHLFNEELMILF